MTDELLWEKQHEMWLLQEYGPLCIALGVEIGQLSGTEVYFLANKIRAVVKREAQARFRTVKGVFETTDYVKCLRSKTATELSALRARVSK